MIRYLIRSFLLPSGDLFNARCVSRLAPSAVQEKTRKKLKTNSKLPAEFYGCARQVKTSPQKLNLVAKLIRFMPYHKALIQLEFCEKKAAKFVKDTLEDTHRRAVEVHGADPTNLFVALSFVGKGTYLRRIRYHGRGMHGTMHKYYSHYFLKLQEGKPPKKIKDKSKSIKYKTQRLIERGPLTIPNSL
jgi:large subunit ribosomal protein L22